MLKWKDHLRIAVAVVALAVGYVFVPGPAPLLAAECTTEICTNERCWYQLGDHSPIEFGYWVDEYF